MTKTPHPAPMPPHPIFTILQSYKISAALFAAIDARLFDTLESGGERASATAEEAAAKAGLPARSTGILLEALAAVNLVTRREEGGAVRYAVEESARPYLLSASPDYVGDWAHLSCHPVMWSGFGRLGEALRAGGAVQDMHAETPDNDFWEVFSRVTAKTASRVAAELSRTALPHLPKKKEGIRILDVACGTGYYGGTLLKEAEQAGAGPSHVTFLDQRNVLPATRQWAREMGIAEKASYLEGSLFDLDWGGPYDAVVLSHIYHHFEPEACKRLTALAMKALAPSGIAIVQEFLADPAPGNPHAAFGAMFSLTMLVWTKKGQSYRGADYDAMFATHGLRRLGHSISAAMPSHVLVYGK